MYGGIRPNLLAFFCKIATMLICCSVVVATVWLVVHFYLQVSQSVSDLRSDSSKHSNQCYIVPFLAQFHRKTWKFEQYFDIVLKFNIVAHCTAAEIHVHVTFTFDTQFPVFCPGRFCRAGRPAFFKKLK